MFCFGGFSNSCSGGKCDVQSGTHLKSKWSCTQLVMKAHCSDLFTHSHTPLDSCHGDWSSKGHTQGYHKTTKHYAENFVWYLRFSCIFYTLIISFTLYCFLTWKWEVMELLVMCSPRASPVILTTSLFPCDFPVHPYDHLNCSPHITAHRKMHLFDQLDSV